MQKRSEKALSLHFRPMLDTEAAYNNLKKQNNNKKQQILGKEKNLISRVSILLDSNVHL